MTEYSARPTSRNLLRTEHSLRQPGDSGLVVTTPSAGAVRLRSPRVLWDDSSPPTHPIEKVGGIQVSENGGAVEAISPSAALEVSKPRRTFTRAALLVGFASALVVTVVIIFAVSPVGFSRQSGPHRGASVYPIVTPSELGPSRSVRTGPLPTPAPATNGFNAQITSPPPGALVGGRVRVAGDVESIRADQHLWVAVKPVGDTRYYPSGSEVVPDGDGSFVSQVYVGGTHAVGNYVVALIVTDARANDTIRGYVLLAAETRVFSGLALPPGAVVLDSREVIRQ
jgi:hypothetical protein